MAAIARKRERLWSAIAARSAPAARAVLAAPDRRGERAAGEELCGRYLDRLRGFFATKCGGDADALARRTLIASVGADAPCARAGFRAYLFALAREELHRHLRQRRGDGVDFSVTSVAELRAPGVPDRRDGGT
jgi:DNA-directed RNA polymerase specialized sigma24 family protein